MSGNVVSVKDHHFTDGPRHRRKIRYDQPHFSDKCPCGHSLATHTALENLATTFKPGQCQAKTCKCTQYGVGEPVTRIEESGHSTENQSS